MNEHQSEFLPWGSAAGKWAVTSDWKLLRHRDKVRLFRLREDRAELNDLAPQEPAIVETLSAAVAAKITDLGTSQKALEEVSAETMERMRALGYLRE